MKIASVLFLCLAMFTSCAGEGPRQESEPLPTILFDEKFTAKADAPAPAGDLYYLETRGLPESLPSPLKDALSELDHALRAKVEAAGYKAAKKRKAAHLYLPIEISVRNHGEGKVSHTIYDPTRFGDHIVRIEGGTIVNVSFFAFQRAHGKRPVLVGEGFLKGAQDSFADASARRESIARLMQTVAIPKSRAPKSAALPGCYPSFGFLLKRDSRIDFSEKTLKAMAANQEHDLSSGDISFSEFPTVDRYFVIQVLAGSAAAKAGIKVGDEIEAIDSVPYKELEKRSDSEEAALYESKMPIPVKFKRAGKIQRGMILPKLLCD